AAMVLRTKGCDASTLHSLAYMPRQDPTTGVITYGLNPDSPLPNCQLLIVDEVSFVDAALATDPLSFGVRMRVLGDPFQLPPVKGEGYFINAQPDIMLTDIQRQAAENPIIRMSIDVREGRGLDPAGYGSLAMVLKRSKTSREELREIVLAADQV